MCVGLILRCCASVNDTPDPTFLELLLRQNTSGYVKTPREMEHNINVVFQQMYC